MFFLKKNFLLVRLVSICFFSLILFTSSTFAGQQWEKVGERIYQGLDNAITIYEMGDHEGAKNAVNDVYYGIYEKDGLESTVRGAISAKSANLTEYQFSKLKKAMRNDASNEEVKAENDKLKAMIEEEIKGVEGAHGSKGGWANFWPAFLIMLREGVEAILVLAAILAYLYRSKNEKWLDTVYNAAIFGIVASFATAYVFTSLMDKAGGANREILEGATALLAVVVLLGTSAWLVGKANAKAWEAYINDMVVNAISAGKARALALASFLAVYREGAEVILFYQALFNGSNGDVEMIWIGFLAGCLVLALIFFLLRKGILAIPIRPFFLFTGVFMFVLAVSFAGSGIKELQEAGVVSITLIESIPMPNIDLLGLYPTVETIGTQLILLILAAGTVYYRKRQLATK